MTNEKITIDTEDYNQLCELVDSTLEYVPTAFREDKTVFFNRIVNKYENSTNETLVMNYDDYHTTRGILKTAISNDAEGYAVEDELYAIVELLDKAEPYKEDN